MTRALGNLTWKVHIKIQRILLNKCTSNICLSLLIHPVLCLTLKWVHQMILHEQVHGTVSVPLSCLFL